MRNCSKIQLVVQMFTLNCKGKLVCLETPLIMGILNITSDSFYKGYLPEGITGILAQAGKLITEGAAFIDVGGQSTKPGSTVLSAEEEKERVLPVIRRIHEQFPEAIISIDTFYSRVAIAAVEAGASVVNDISGGNMDKQMINTVAALKVPYVCTHMQGVPATMQMEPRYDNVIKEVLEFFINKINECERAGIADIIIDPGFGFGKTIGHNFELLRNLDVFKMLQKPILAGLSRKGTIYKTLQITADEALNGTTVLNTLALNNGAKILRAHDVKEAVEAVKLVEAYNS